MGTRFTRRGFLAGTLAFGGAIIAAGCQPQVVEKQVEVTKIVEKPVEVTKVVEKAVEVTKIVEKPVEVTKVVQTVVTPTPGRVKLVYWDWWGKASPQEKEWWDWVEKTYKAKFTNVDYEYQNIPWDDYMTKFLTAFTGGSPPDAMACATDWGSTFWEKAAIRDLGDYIRDSKEIRMNNYAQSSIDFITYKGHVFAVPASGPDSYILVGNQGLLEKQGVDLQKLTSYDAMKEAAVKLTEKDSSGKVTRAGFLLSQLSNLDRTYVWLLTAGSNLYDKEQTKVVFNTPENRPKSLEMLNFLVDLQYGSKVSMPFEAGRDVTALFGQGKAAIIEAGNWNLPRYQETFADLKTDIILYPAGPHGSAPTTHTWTNMQVLPSRTKNPDVAWSFVEFHSSTSSQIKRMQVMGVNGPPLDMYKSPEWAALVKKIPAYGRYPDIIVAGKFLDYRRFKEVEQAAIPLFQAVMLQKEKPEDALNKAEAAANEVLATPV